MRRSERIRRLSRLVPWPTLLLAAACGGGDKGPTGPGGGAGGGTYELVALGNAGLPIDLQIEDCLMTRFYGGELSLHEDGTWQQALGFYDDNYGDATARDEGTFEQDGATMWLTSEYSGVTHQATVGGGQVRIMYDWCYNGVPDVQLVFDR